MLIKDGLIKKIFDHTNPEQIKQEEKLINDTELNVTEAKGKYLLPGVIDDQVHFREPGLTHKADLFTESRAAVAGGITSFMDMPNTNPRVLTQELLEDKYRIAAEKSYANYSFYMGSSNDNIDEILRTDPQKVCGVKVFMGASTGNMLVDKPETLEAIFSQCKSLIAVHCEDETIIQSNIKKAKERYGENIPVTMHPLIRNAESCFKSSSLAVSLAQKYGSRLHILHLSTAKELALLSNKLKAKDKQITCEVCVQHLWFSEEDYQSKGNFIKWNPAIKSKIDREALRAALNDDRLDVIATDHAPHTLEEKSNPYLLCPSGGPMVQHSLVAMLELYLQKFFSLEKIVEKMCHAPADIFHIDKRGYIREGYHADLVLVDIAEASGQVYKSPGLMGLASGEAFASEGPEFTQFANEDPERAKNKASSQGHKPWQVNKSNILYKCGWSPFEGQEFNSRVIYTWVNGNLVYENIDGKHVFDDSFRGARLLFNCKGLGFI